MVESVARHLSMSLTCVYGEVPANTLPVSVNQGGLPERAYVNVPEPPDAAGRVIDSASPPSNVREPIAGSVIGLRLTVNLNVRLSV